MPKERNHVYGDLHVDDHSNRDWPARSAPHGMNAARAGRALTALRPGSGSARIPVRPTSTEVRNNEPEDPHRVTINFDQLGAEAMTTAAPGFYAAHRPYVVPEDLAGLRGPTTGVVHLPIHLDWSPAPDYDLNDPDRSRWLYVRVIREASNVADLQRYLDGPTVGRLWPRLALPARCRELWESRFPDLRGER